MILTKTKVLIIFSVIFGVIIVAITLFFLFSENLSNSSGLPTTPTIVQNNPEQIRIQRLEKMNNWRGW